MLVGVQYDNAPLPNFCLENPVFLLFSFLFVFDDAVKYFTVRLKTFCW